jgi:hypothetical protein
MTVGLLKSVVELDLQRREIQIHRAFHAVLIFWEIKRRVRRAKLTVGHDQCRTAHGVAFSAFSAAFHPRLLPTPKIHVR